MSLKTTAAGLAEGGKEISRQWQEVRAHWRDQKAEEFEAAYLEALPSAVAKSIEAMVELEKFLQKVRHECE